MQNPLILFTISELDILIKSLDNFSFESNADDPLETSSAAFISNLGLFKSEDNEKQLNLVNWIDNWFSTGGNRETLIKTLNLLLEQKRGFISLENQLQLVWSGPDSGSGSLMRDQSILIKQLVDSAKDRLLLTTYTFYKGQFIEDLFSQIREKMIKNPKLIVRFVCNINRPKGSNILPEELHHKFKRETWPKLWSQLPYPELYFDPRSIKINSSSVCHVKAVVSDRKLLVTSANLTDSAQLNNFELGVKIESQFSADATWDHFDKLIKKGMLKKV